MDQLRIEIWDLIYRSGPQSIDQICGELRLDSVTTLDVVNHEWFELQGTTVQIAKGKPTTVSQEPSE